ncbi:deleted in malignant brain tumors 1 protein-like [Mytilus californianus]|uniref:deleted in malignant brain tumors 1 protein-like n=1 Tax=Mytilus californianus TaxID=6549 RepID=UPI002247B519|nr:deleted in malignant brain tumors 1 protein-like [Mytilus californianus]
MNGVFVLLFVSTLIVWKVSAQCSGTAENTSVGYTTVKVSAPGYPSPGYAGNLNCAWLGSSFISGAVILFKVTDITLSCAGDAINVYDGTSTSGSQEHTNECKSGSGPRTLGYKTASTGNVYTTFTSDATSSASELGFLMYMISAIDVSGTGCTSAQSLITTSTEQYLSSPNFPSNYPLNTDCTWDITTKNTNANVILKILFMDIEYEPSCGYDYITITESGSTTTKHCTEDVWEPTYTYTSSGNYFHIEFKSDNASPKRGFLLSYVQTDTSTAQSSGQSDGDSAVGLVCGVVAASLLGATAIVVAIVLYKKYTIKQKINDSKIGHKESSHGRYDDNKNVSYTDSIIFALPECNKVMPQKAVFSEKFL